MSYFILRLDENQDVGWSGVASRWLFNGDSTGIFCSSDVHL